MAPAPQSASGAAAGPAPPGQGSHFGSRRLRWAAAPAEAHPRLQQLPADGFQFVLPLWTSGGGDGGGGGWPTPLGPALACRGRQAPGPRAAPATRSHCVGCGSFRWLGSAFCSTRALPVLRQQGCPKCASSGRPRPAASARASAALPRRWPNAGTHGGACSWRLFGREESRSCAPRSLGAGAMHEGSGLLPLRRRPSTPTWGRPWRWPPCSSLSPFAKCSRSTLSASGRPSPDPDTMWPLRPPAECLDRCSSASGPAGPVWRHRRRKWRHAEAAFYAARERVAQADMALLANDGALRGYERAWKRRPIGFPVKKEREEARCLAGAGGGVGCCLLGAGSSDLQKRPASV